MQMSSHF
jgi:hypothetical protein